MKTVTELFSYLDSCIPREMSEEWDNDGVMIGCADKPAAKVLIVLDVTDAAVSYAAANGFDVMVSHHPLIFSPLKSVSSNKILTLVKNDIAVFSFHTRLDAVDPGVNDALAARIGLKNVVSDGMLRIGSTDHEMTADEFAHHIRSTLGAGNITAALNHDNINTVAVLGGSGKDFIYQAYEAGADTFLTGEISYNAMSEACDDTCMNIFTAGHYATEFPVCGLLEKMIKDFDGDIYTEIADLNNLTSI